MQIPSSMKLRMCASELTAVSSLCPDNESHHARMQRKEAGIGAEMLKRAWLWFEIGCGLLALTIFTLACHAMWPDMDGVAAWFQAVGSVIGIGIAIWVPAKQARDARADARHIKAEELRAVRALGWLSVGSVELWWGSMQQSKDDFDKAAFQRGMKALAAVPMHALPSPRAVRAVSALQRRLPTLFDAVNSVRSTSLEYEGNRRRELNRKAHEDLIAANTLLEELSAVANEIEDVS